MRQRERATELLDGLIVVFLAGMFSGIGLSFAVRSNQTIVPQVLRAATSVLIGLFTGLTARRALRGRSGVLRASAALAALGLGLYFLGFFSRDLAGLAVPRTLPPAPDWEGLLQISLGAFSALLALRAWPAADTRRQVASRSRVPAEAKPPRPQAPQKRRNGAGRPRPRAARGGRLPPRLSAWVSQRNPLARRGRRVRLVGAEAHRCPYCLEPVGGGDPRGVVECRVCHTRHHADCWAVTGTCQVPHYHR